MDIRPAHLVLLVDEASIGANRLTRQLRLCRDDRDDVFQQLIETLCRSYPTFDEARGTLGAFANAIVRNRLRRLAKDMRQRRSRFVSLGEVLGGCFDENDGCAGQDIPEAEGYPAALGQCSKPFEAVERSIDLDRAVGLLDPTLARLCVDLLALTPTELIGAKRYSRDRLYAHLKEVKHCLTAFGLRPRAEHFSEDADRYEHGK